MSKDLTRSVRNVKQRRDIKRRRAIKIARYRGTTKTKNRTFLYEGLEFNQWPTEKFLLKAVKKEWAEDFLRIGRICLNSMSFYHDHDSGEIGDSLEGKGALVVQGVMVNVESINQHYMWCCSLPSTSRKALYSLSDEHNVIVRVDNISELMKRMEKAMIENGICIAPPHFGKVSYSRGSVSSNGGTGSKWLWNCFQKRAQYQHQRECRIVLTNLNSFKQRSERLFIDIGACSDIASISDKPVS